VSNEDQPPEDRPKTKGHWILWTLLALFVVISIGVMFAVDYYYAGDSGASTAAPGVPEN
jgi:hypothetical protein